jgi:hypothetical protein
MRANFFYPSEVLSDLCVFSLSTPPWKSASPPSTDFSEYKFVWNGPPSRPFGTRKFVSRIRSARILHLSIESTNPFAGAYPAGLLVYPPDLFATQSLRLSVEPPNRCVSTIRACSRSLVHQPDRYWRMLETTKKMMRIAWVVAHARTKFVDKRK